MQQLRTTDLLVNYWNHRTTARQQQVFIYIKDVAETDTLTHSRIILFMDFWPKSTTKTAFPFVKVSVVFHVSFAESENVTRGVTSLHILQDSQRECPACSLCV